MASYKNAIEKSLALRSRTEPGRGVALPDDGMPGNIHLKSVPNVPTERLRRAQEFYHGSIHTQDGLHEFDMPRRSLIDTGVKLQAITHELRLRGEPKGDCPTCWGHLD